jgi:endonuclease YncB( thermonuclease family)
MAEQEPMLEFCEIFANFRQTMKNALIIRLSRAVYGCTLIMFGFAICAQSAFAADLILHSYVIIAPDASLMIRSRKVRFDAIHIPPTTRICDTRLRPVECGSRAAVALRFKIQGFVRCRVNRKESDGTHFSICWYDGVDLGEWLIREGWALATPNAPFSYTAAERIARARKRGVLGIPGIEH